MSDKMPTFAAFSRELRSPLHLGSRRAGVRLAAGELLPGAAINGVGGEIARGEGGYASSWVKVIPGGPRAAVRYSAVLCLPEWQFRRGNARRIDVPPLPTAGWEREAHGLQGSDFASIPRQERHMGWFSKTDEGFFLATVVPDTEGARVAKYLGLVNGEAIIGANIFRDMFSSVRDVVGGRAGGYERALSGARNAALQDMIAAAREMGADGVVGIDFDYEVLGETNGMMMVAVSGTAVKMA